MLSYLLFFLRKDTTVFWYIKLAHFGNKAVKKFLASNKSISILPWPCRVSGEEFACQAGLWGFNLWDGKINWRRKWQPTPVFLPGKSHAQRNLVGCGPWSAKELEMTWQLNNNNNKKYASEFTKYLFKTSFLGTSLVVQWLRLCSSNAGDVSLILGWGIKIPRALWGVQNLKKKKKK